MSRETGQLAEYFVMEYLRNKKIPYEYVDSWYDLMIQGKYVEIKSAKIVVKNGSKNNKANKYQQIRAGRFDFSSQANREDLRKANGIVILVGVYKNQHILFGCAEAKKLPDKRYIPMRFIKSEAVRDLEEFFIPANEVVNGKNL